MDLVRGAVQDPAADGRWRICVSPDFAPPGTLPRELPPLQAHDEPAARAWLSLLAHTWLRLVEAQEPHQRSRYGAAAQ